MMAFEDAKTKVDAKQSTTHTHIQIASAVLRLINEKSKKKGSVERMQ